MATTWRIAALVGIGIVAGSAHAESRGDLNHDGVVDAHDLAELVRALGDGGLPPGAAMRLDINGDLSVDALDVAYLAEIVSGVRGSGLTCYPRGPFCCQFAPPYGCCGEEQCPEEGEDEEGGIGDIGDPGGGDNNGGGGGWVEGPCADCDKYYVDGPKYLAAGDAPWAWGGWDRWYCNSIHAPGEVEIVSGSHLIENGVVGDQPGTITMRVTRELQDGTVCTGTHTIRVVRFLPVRLRYATFIECPVLVNPLGWLPTVDSDYFGGDDRTFDMFAQSYRSVHERLVAPHLFPITGPENFPYNLGQYYVSGTVPPFGLSTGYDASAITPNPLPGLCSTLLLPGSTPVVSEHAQLDEAQAPDFTGRWQDFHDDGNFALAVRRTGPKTMKVYFWLAGSNPLFWQSPPIKGFFVFDLRFAVDQRTGQRLVTVFRHGWHGRFPAHEIYVNNITLVNYSPLNDPDGPFGPGSLVQGLAVEVQQAGPVAINQ